MNAAGSHTNKGPTHVKATCRTKFLTGAEYPQLCWTQDCLNFAGVCKCYSKRLSTFWSSNNAFSLLQGHEDFERPHYSPSVLLFSFSRQRMGDLASRFTGAATARECFVSTMRLKRSKEEVDSLSGRLPLKHLRLVGGKRLHGCFPPPPTPPPTPTSSDESQWDTLFPACTRRQDV
jgi:hypothetical protein